jgi:hypothetical protein
MVQVEHPALPFRLGTPQVGLHPGHRLRVEPVEQALRPCPRRLGGVARDHVRPDAEPHRPSEVLGDAPDPRELLGDGRKSPTRAARAPPRR